MGEWKAFTDGSAQPNPGPGGAGSVILHNDKVIAEIIYTGGETTNNRMELYAVIMTFKYIPKDKPVIIYTDSGYVQKGITEWIHGWVNRDWKTASKKSVLNQDLWKKLLTLQQEYNVQIKWIKAHQDKLPESERVKGWEWNMKADELAGIGTERSIRLKDSN